jgi:hypothetical protein
MEWTQEQQYTSWEDPEDIQINLVQVSQMRNLNYFIPILSNLQLSDRKHLPLTRHLQIFVF